MAQKKARKTNISVVSALIERDHGGHKQILVQTRWKPDRDPEYSGTLEIPAGWIDEYEDVHEALRREIKEETGLTVTQIIPDRRTATHSPREDGAFAFESFCCQQMIQGGRPYVGFVFLCRVRDEEPREQKEETRDVRWMDAEELRSLFESAPEKIFTLQLGVIDYYLNYADR